MHGPVRDKLEDLLQAGNRRGTCAEHLEECQECSAQLETMKSQAAEFRSLRQSDLIEPAPGFYARVLQKIEEEETESIWSFFFESSFSRRLAVASLAIAVGLGTYVVRQERSDEQRVGQTTLALNSPHHYDEPVMGSQSEQRDAVLENFAVHLVQTEGQVR